ncbi:hypothetical protein AMJ39_02755 [candidate division TA06 bacterium DG_24]|uniref:Radical SAM core domain-containing protein n=3 Tax=Bacteria division TA06 TaxID=1156500 RepID=A0A0S8JLU7_UNCT6|nr:MAG: hypothetical protein AMJ39_02755 [candidate division TA06 bacterium DG_24]KPK69703.1 MAG: hypothetical protein AMJ82_05025 [candidate division TA06 bacterium SM23_40]KPL10713.1 MAG: hypothetical protein AMJ71_02150 [candidate division TA06 bacterium SM1_40]
MSTHSTVFGEVDSPRHEADLYDRLENRRVQCNVCLRRCIVADGRAGYCFTRRNEGGRMVTLIYGAVSTWSVAPIEIKPLYHFYPGSHALSFGSFGCNFRCIGCQNWEIAHVGPTRLGVKERRVTLDRAVRISPAQSVEMALRHGCQGLSWTYNEPALWLEYATEAARLAKRRGLYTNFVTNGALTPEALDYIGPSLDGFRVDLKGSRSHTYRRLANFRALDELLETIERAHRMWKMHVEVVTNVTPGYNDSKEELHGIARFIATRLGPDVPWHVTRFVPHLRLSHLPLTPVGTLEVACEIGRREGLKYVYIGNVSGHPANHTYCPECGHRVIERRVHGVVSISLVKGRCPACGTSIPIIGLSPMDVA